MPDADESRRGLVAGAIAYLAWGVFPLYFHAMLPASGVEVLAHRILWSAVLCIGVLVVQRDGAWIKPLVRRPRLLLGTFAAAVLIAINWLVYVVAVMGGHTAEASLGYFLNPVVTVGLGVVVLGERLTALQRIAVGIGAVAAVYLTVGGGTVPWIALTLATSFGLYGLTKKRIGTVLTAVQGLTVETVILAPAALGVVIWLAVTGSSTFAGHGPAHLALLVSSGLVTTVPLVLFAAAARRVPLVTIGLLQFVTPVIQLLCAVVVLGEPVAPHQWVGFGIVWLALTALVVDTALAVRAPMARLRQSPSTRRV